MFQDRVFTGVWEFGRSQEVERGRFGVSLRARSTHRCILYFTYESTIPNISSDDPILANSK